MGNRPSYAEISRRLEALEQEHQRLKRSHARLEALIEGAGHPMGIYDGEGVLRMMNASGAANLGGRPEDYIGRPLQELFPDRAEVYLDRIRKAIASHGSSTPDRVYEDEVLLPVGRRWFSSTYKVIGDGAGGILGVQVISLDITEQKKTQEALAWNERLLSIVADRLPAFLAYVGADQRYQYVNKKYEDVTGQPRGRFLNRHVKSIVGASYFAEILPFIEKALTGQSVTYERWARLGNSGPMWVEANYVPDVDADGTLRGYVVLTYDLTERKKNEEALRKSEEKFRALVEFSSDHIFLLAPDGTYLMSNGRTAHFDLPPGTVLAGKRIGEVYPPDVAAVYRKHLGQVLASGRVVDFEHSLDGGGTEVYHLDTLFPVFKDGNIWCVGGICRDITRLKKTEKQLKSSEQRYRGLIRDMPNPMVRLKPDGVLIFVNESYRRIFGKAAEEFAGRLIWDQIPPEDHDRLRRHFESLTVQDSVGEITERARLPNGELRWFQWVDRAFFDDDGRMTEIQAIGWDVTKEREAHEALVLSSARLSLLRDVDREILQLKPQEEIAAGALRGIRQLIPCQRASLQVRDPESGEGMILAVDSDLPSGLNPDAWFPAGFLDGSEALGQGRIHAVADIDALEKPTDLQRALREQGVRAFACLPLMVHGAYLGSINFGFDSPTSMGPEQVEIAREAADSVAIAIHNSRLFQASENQRRQLQALAHRLTTAEDTLRRLLSLELHDRLGPNLTALSINLGVITALLGAGRADEAVARLRDSQGLVEEAARLTRDLMSELRPPDLDDYGLAAAVCVYADLFQRRTGIAVEVVEEEPLPRLDPETEAALFRVVQEGLTNAAKHARARTVRVDFRPAPALVRIAIEDDGQGFDPASVRPAEQMPALGLVFMQERVLALGGRLVIHAVPGRGTRLEIEIAR